MVSYRTNTAEEFAATQNIFKPARVGNPVSLVLLGMQLVLSTWLMPREVISEIRGSDWVRAGSILWEGELHIEC